LWGAVPAATGRHCPVVLEGWPFRSLVHAEHPPHAWLQHTPSAQKPEVHSLAAAHS
jgi:hypothetical protein